MDTIDMLLESMAHNNEEVLDKIVNCHKKSRKVSYQGFDNLQSAVAQQKRGVVKHELDKGAIVNAKTPDGRSCLYLAVEGDDIEIMKLLLAKKANVNAKNEENRTPLHCAVEARNYEAARLLLKHKASVDAADDDGTTPLALATTDDKDPKIIQLLLENGADPNFVHGDSNVTPFLESFDRKSSMAVMKSFLDHGAYIHHVDAAGYNPVFRSARYSSDEMIRKLIDLGANVTQKIDTGHTFLHMYLEGYERDANEAISMIKLARQKGVDINARENLTGTTALHTCVGWKNTRVLEYMLSLEEVDPNARDLYYGGGRNLLEHAVIACNPAALEFLLNHKRVALKRKDHESLLTKASEFYEYESDRSKCLEMIKLLMERGVTLKDHQSFNVKTFERIRQYEEKFKEGHDDAGSKARFPFDTRGWMEDDEVLKRHAKMVLDAAMSPDAKECRIQ